MMLAAWRRGVEEVGVRHDEHAERRTRQPTGRGSVWPDPSQAIGSAAMIGQGTYAGTRQGALIAHASRFVRFGVVGGVGAVINMVILYLLVHYGGWNHMAAAVVATETAIL